jgi:hypothetical protein
VFVFPFLIDHPQGDKGDEKDEKVEKTETKKGRKGGKAKEETPDAAVLDSDMDK